MFATDPKDMCLAAHYECLCQKVKGHDGDHEDRGTEGIVSPCTWPK